MTQNLNSASAAVAQTAVERPEPTAVSELHQGAPCTEAPQSGVGAELRARIAELEEENRMLRAELAGNQRELMAAAAMRRH